MADAQSVKGEGRIRALLADPDAKPAFLGFLGTLACGYLLSHWMPLEMAKAFEAPMTWAFNTMLVVNLYAAFNIPFPQEREKHWRLYVVNMILLVVYFGTTWALRGAGP